MVLGEPSEWLQFSACIVGALACSCCACQKIGNMRRYSREKPSIVRFTVSVDCTSTYCQSSDTQSSAVAWVERATYTLLWSFNLFRCFSGARGLYCFLITVALRHCFSLSGLVSVSPFVPSVDTSSTRILLLQTQNLQFSFDP